jgi:sugar phosphate isomerase/epimerase
MSFVPAQPVSNQPFLHRGSIMVQLSINQVTSKQWTLEEDAFYYDQFHFQGAGLWRFKLDECGTEKTRAVMEENHLSVSSLSFVGGFTGSDGAWSESVLDAMAALDMARDLGAPSVMLHTGAKNRHIDSHARRCVTKAIDRLLPLAEEFGIRLLLQPMLESVSRRWNFLHDWEAVFQIIDRYPADAVGFVLNTHHASFLTEIWDRLPGRVEQLGLVQISDSVHLPRAGKRRDDCLLGQGHLLPDHRLRQILDLGYAGWVEVELLGATWGREGYQQVLESSQQFASEFFKPHSTSSRRSIKQDVI